MSKKLDGYVAQFSPTEIRGIAKEAVPLPDDKISSEGRITNAQNEYEKAKAESDKYENMSFFGKVKEGLGILGEQARQRNEQRKTEFFANKNEPNKPDEPSIGNSFPDVVESGKKFFRQATGFFTGK